MYLTLSRWPERNPVPSNRMYPLAQKNLVLCILSKFDLMNSSPSNLSIWPKYLSSNFNICQETLSHEMRQYWGFYRNTGENIIDFFSPYVGMKRFVPGIAANVLTAGWQLFATRKSPVHFMLTNKCADVWQRRPITSLQVSWKEASSFSSRLCNSILKWHMLFW